MTIIRPRVGRSLGGTDHASLEVRRLSILIFACVSRGHCTQYMEEGKIVCSPNINYAMKSIDHGMSICASGRIGIVGDLGFSEATTFIQNRWIV